MRTVAFARAALACCVFAAALIRGNVSESAEAGEPAEARFYVVDVGLGNCIFVVAPSGEVLLLDTGADHAAKRVLTFKEQNGIQRIDYLLVSHFENDHMGAAPAIAEKVPVDCFVDHGESVVYGKDDAWWKQRRGPWFREGMGAQYDRSYDAYRAARAKARHQVVKPGDRVPVTGLTVDVVTAGGTVLTQPLPGAGAANPACEGAKRRADDDAEDGQSIGVVVSWYSCPLPAKRASLTWNGSHS